MAVRYAPGRFIEAVEHHARLGAGLRGVLHRYDREFAVLSGSSRVATIRPTCAYQATQVNRGNFLAAGEHWERLAAAVGARRHVGCHISRAPPPRNRSRR